MDSLWQIQRQAGIITLSGLYYNYSRFKDNAASSSLITVSNDQFYDKYIYGVWQNPYQTETVFAMSPPLHVYKGRNFQVVLPSNLWLSNNAPSVNSIAVDFNDGMGYKPIAMNQPLNNSYADTGSKTWTFRLTLTNGTNLYSHTEMRIEPEPNNFASTSGNIASRFLRPEGPIFLTADDAFDGQFGQGWITVDYANPADATGRFRLLRPLIVVEGFDPGHLLSPELEFGITDYRSFIDQINNPFASTQLRNLLQGNNQQYDIIYVDWASGTDFLQRNALLLERVIRWVNEQKAADGSLEPNVVLGQSMGGVISRWALRNMENRGLNHQTRLFISWDAPQQGANVPLAYQHLARHAKNLLVQSAIPVLLGGTNMIRIARSALNLMDVPAARQMLYNRVVDNGQLNNSDHNTWQSELRNLGYPQQCRNIAVSNGSECALGQGFEPNADLLKVNGRANTRFLTDMLGQLGLPIIGRVLLKPQFLLGILNGRNDFSLEFNCKAQPAIGTGQIYKGKITYTKKVLWLVNVNTTITDRSRNADASVLPIDGTPGGMYDTRINLQDQDFRNWAIRYNLTASNVPDFNFIPTTSSLDIGGGNTALALAHYQARYIGATPPVTPLSTPFANFTTAFNQVVMSNANINNNENHIEISPRNGNWVAEELNGNLNIRSNCSGACGNNVIDGAASICTEATYTIPQSLGANITWSIVNPTGIANIFPAGNSVRVVRNGNSAGTITLRSVSAGDCNGTATFTKQIQIGGTPPGAITFDLVDPVMGKLYANIEPVAGATSYNWYKNGELNTLWNGTSAHFSIPRDCGMEYDIAVEAVSSCGISSQSHANAYVPCDEYYVLSPNPATSDVTISANETRAVTSTNTTFDEVRIYDLRGNLKKYQKYKKVKQARINISGLSNGTYFIEIVNDNYKERKQLVIQK